MTFHPREIQVFLAVHQHGTIGRAAKELHLTQPAVSRCIKRLEEQLGVELFERCATGMALTPFGDAFKPHAELLQSEMSNAMETILAMRGLQRGVLRIGAIGSAISTLFPETMQSFREHYPGLSIRLHEDIEDRLFEGLTNASFDLAVVTIPFDDERVSLIPMPFLGDTFAIMARIDHPLHKKPDLTLHDLLQYPWISPPPSSQVTQRTKELFTSQGLAAPEVWVESRSITAVRAMLPYMDLLSYMPKPLMTAEIAAGLVRPLELPLSPKLWERNFYLYRRSQGILPPPAQAFLHVLQDFSQKRSTQA